MKRKEKKKVKTADKDLNNFETCFKVSSVSAHVCEVSGSSFSAIPKL